MKYAVIKDNRTGKLYIDLSGSMIRNFEVVLGEGDNKDKLLKKYNRKNNIVTDLTITKEEAQNIFEN